MSNAAVTARLEGRPRSMGGQGGGWPRPSPTPLGWAPRGVGNRRGCLVGSHIHAPHFCAQTRLRLGCWGLRGRVSALRWSCPVRETCLRRFFLCLVGLYRAPGRVGEAVSVPGLPLRWDLLALQALAGGGLGGLGSHYSSPLGPTSFSEASRASMRGRRSRKGGFGVVSRAHAITFLLRHLYPQTERELATSHGLASGGGPVSGGPVALTHRRSAYSTLRQTCR